MDWAEPLGLGELGLKPWEFWALTPREFLLMLQGFFRREDRDWYRTATLGVWVLGPWSKKRLTPEKLLGRQFKLMPVRKDRG